MNTQGKNETIPKNGKPLQVSGDKIYGRSGTAVGRIKVEKVFAPGGRYIETIVNDRLIFRSTHSASIYSPIASANRAGPAAWDDEPNIPDQTLIYEASATTYFLLVIFIALVASIIKGWQKG
ncbi:hypothetical protein ACG1BZ_07050 [Microbulbifer sp. CNSA002]|uniref:hypothetical protein n=1 Tax=Microbulbifer sp. CNSA002 TaxID=3373604 RepID=UPI0039B3E259